MKYTDAKQIFERCKDKGRGARLTGRSTRLVKTGKGYGIQYHNTIVVEILPNEYVLNSGGYQTNTTKDRINTYSPVRLYSRKYTWYIGEYSPDTDIPFLDGIRVNSNGKVISSVKEARKAVDIRNTKLKRVKEYVKGFIQQIEQGALPRPSGGDCWAETI
jgi:hypothetical protein